jgi:hypothetical protein
MAKDRGDTPVLGTAVPRPTAKRVEPLSPAAMEPMEPESVAAPDNPTLQQIYRLIDERMPPQIAVRISSMPPPAEPVPRPSLAVRSAKATGRWGKIAVLAIGLLSLAGQFVAEIEKYRGPISQAFVIIAQVLDRQDAPAAPETEPAAPPVGGERQDADDAR